MTTALWLGILSAATAIYGIYSNHQLKKMDLRLKERELQDIECKTELERMGERLRELEEDRDKAIKLAVEQYQNKNL